MGRCYHVGLIIGLIGVTFLSGCLRTARESTADSMEIADHAGVTTGCARCHEKSRPSVVRLPAPATAMQGHFPEQDCGKCHQRRTVDRPGFFFAHNDAENRSFTACLPCHEARRKTPDHFAGQDCATCHRTSALPWKESIENPHELPGPAPQTCAMCHESDRKSPTHYLSNDCVLCHTAPGVSWGQVNFSHEPVPSTCVGCHAGDKPNALNPYGASFFHYRQGDCAYCHKSPGVNWGMPRPFTHPADSISRCSDCHFPPGWRP